MKRNFVLNLNPQGKLYAKKDNSRATLYQCAKKTHMRELLMLLSVKYLEFYFRNL